MIFDNMYIRTLKEDDLDAILGLQEKTILGLKDSTVLRKNTPEILTQSLSSDNIALGAFIENDLVAVGFAVNPLPPETDLRINLQTHSVDKALDLKLIIVKDEYRGNGLQKALTWVLEKIAHVHGYTHFCASVSPNNSYSLNNVLSMGYEYDHQEELYDGLLRNIYVKELKVSEFNSQLIIAASKYEGSTKPDFAFNTSDYIAGDISLCSTGDIAEFLNEETGDIIHGLIIKKYTALVLLKNTDGTWEITELDTKLYNYKLQRVLLNVRPNNPLNK